MKFNKNINKIAFLGLSVFILNACKKIATTDPIGDAGSTYVHLLGGGDAPNVGSSLLGVDFVNRPQAVDVADIRRDAANSLDLNKACKVVIKDDTAAVTQYNTANGSSYVHLPRSWYTANFPATSMGGTYTLPFAAGEFAKQITITIPNATLLDPSTTYALAFTLVSNDGGFKNAIGKTLVFAIGAKNKYDGIYSLRIFQSGWTAYGISDGLTNDYPDNMSLITISAGGNKIFNNYTGTYLLAGFAFPISATQFGATTPVFTFDPATDRLIAVTNSTPDDGRQRTLVLDPAVTNSRYDPATKKIYAAFYMTQTGRPNQIFRDTLTFVKPR